MHRRKINGRRGKVHGELRNVVVAKSRKIKRTDKIKTEKVQKRSEEDGNILDNMGIRKCNSIGHI